ncbi:hypothetical protein CYMTET_4310 [Cymbomonas tetramitiformis]|uniref:Uncharacterized protein n=1 Tax=Cymbomonas tetramitiformis TaxID=36881 RepID=A0AAE0H1F9_9CHLO|nr:hypothetical protein CYMTET_4310 [Cymbomonas tetramitiformis]
MTTRSLTTDIVKRVRESGLHRKWAKNLRETVLGGKHEKFAGKDKDVAKLGKLIVILKTEFSTAGLDLASVEFNNPALEVIPLINELVYDTFSEVEEYAALRYPARVDPRPVLTKEHRLARENRAANWQPTEATRRQQLFYRLDPDFYRAGEVVGTAAAAAIPTGDDSEAKQLLKIVVDKLRVLEHFIKTRREVAFDPDARRAVPRCSKCAKVDTGILYHAYKDYPLGGGRPGAHAFCSPTAENDENEMRALALCHVHQQAAGDGPEAFSQVCDVHGRDAWRVGGIYERLTSLADAVGLSLTTASIAGGEAGDLSANAVSMLPAAAAGGDGERALVAQSEGA